MSYIVGLSELWIGFGSRKTYKDIPIYHTSQMLGPQQCQALPLFHAFTGSTLYQQCLELAKRLHGMHGLPFLRSPTPSSPSPKTRPASHLIQFICNVSSAGRYSCTVRTVVHTHGMKQGSSCSPMASIHWTQSPQHSMLYSCILSVPCSLQPLFGSSPSPKKTRSQNLVNGAGNGIPEPNQTVGAILDRSGRCQLCMLTSPPLWLCGCL